MDKHRPTEKPHQQEKAHLIGETEQWLQDGRDVRRDEKEREPAKELSAKELREMLLQDMRNISLRKRYLAVRPEHLRRLDEKIKLEGINWLLGRLLRGAITYGAMGAFIGLGLGCLKLLLFPSPGVGMVEVQKRDLAFLAGTSWLGFMSAMAPWTIRCLHRRRMAKRINDLTGVFGPLPDDAPPDLEKASKEFLGE